jgi:hypothetical protein
MSVRPSACNNLAATGCIDRILTFIYFSKICLENSSLLKSMIAGTLHEDLCKFVISRWILVRIRCFRPRLQKKINIHILCSVTVFRKFYRLWENVVKCAKATQATIDKIIQRMRFACWITKLRVCNTSFTWQQLVTRTRLSVMLYVLTLPVL